MSLDYRPEDNVDGPVFGSENAWHDLDDAESAQEAEPAAARRHRDGNLGALTVVLVVLAIVAATGIGLMVMLSGGSDAGTEPSPGVEDGAAPVPAEELLLEVGDCLRGPFEGYAPDAFGVVACSVAHRGEIVFLDQDFFAGEESMPRMQQIER
jgi:hypothetical protein